MVMLAEHGLDQAASVRLCNAKPMLLADGTWKRFEAIDSKGGLRGLVRGATHAILQKDDGAVVGLALLCKAAGASQYAASLRNSAFYDAAGGRLTLDAALRRIRGGGDELVHELILLCGSAQGRTLLQAATSVLSSPALLFVNAAYDPDARRHLWQVVYRDRLGFRRVDELRVAVEGAEEIPMVTSLDALKARL